MNRKPPADESAQCADIYFNAQTLFPDPLRSGDDPHAIADALLEAARDVLADNHEFMIVFERFRKRRNLG
jgi:hypothetical protein